jgi:pimeloyl-ACP methyl ester carboxylesterase
VVSVRSRSRAIDAQSEPVILVGHSYGGAVITEAGAHPNVAALVYIAAFAPDAGDCKYAHRRSAARRACAADPAAAGLALGGAISEPAWRSRPSWYLVATEDRMIPPAAQRQMSARAGATVVEVAGSHAIYVSQPAAVAELIETAVNATIPAAVGA